MSIFSSNNNFLGVDIGSSSIKLVELKRQAGKLRLLTYSFTENIETVTKKDWHKDASYTARLINKMCQKAGTSSRNAVAALPTFSVFSSIINLPNISKKEVFSAVHWEAKKVIPLPLEEMVLDWKIIDDKNNKTTEDGKKKQPNTRVLLTGAPKTLVEKYIKIFKEAHINLLSLETETFSLIRSLLGNDKSTVMIVEIGTSTTDVSIVTNSIPILSRSIDVGGETITEAISHNLDIGKERAEQFKYDLGITSTDSKEDVVPKTIASSIDPIVNEIKYMLNLFQDKHNTTVEKIILSGGSSLLPNLVNYLEKVLNKDVIIGDAWSRISYPTELKSTLDEVGPKLSVSIGLAMREME